MIVFEGTYFHALILNNKYCTLQIHVRSLACLPAPEREEIATQLHFVPVGRLPVPRHRRARTARGVYRNGYYVDVRDRSGLPAKIGAAVDNAEDADDFEDENDDLSVGWRRRESKDDWLSLGILLIFKSHHKLFLKERRRRLLWTCFASGSSSADGWMDRPVSAKQSKKCLSTINFEEMLYQCTRLVILTINNI